MKWTIFGAANEFGVNRERIVRGLRLQNIAYEAGKEYTTPEIFKALAGDWHIERTLLTRAQREKEEIEVALAKKEVLNREEVTKYITSTFAPVREKILTLPDLADKRNPVDPTLAREHLLAFVDQFLKYCRENKPKIIVDL